MSSKQIRNSTAEFLIFTAQTGESSIEARYQDQTVWLTQKLMAELFAVDVRTISEHLKNIFASGELDEGSVIRKFRITAADGKTYATNHYNRDAPTTKAFFAQVQNKLHFAIHGHTAAELIRRRADAGQANMELTSWENAPTGKIVKTDVTVAKNYLSQEELAALGRIVNAYLDLAEERAQRNIPMTMEDWAKRLDAFLEFTEREVLQDADKVSAKAAKAYAESEFERYRIVQDRLFENDFDRAVKVLTDSGQAGQS